MIELVFAGWEPYDLHDLAHTCWAGSVVHTDPAQPRTMAGEELDDLDDLDHDLSNSTCAFLPRKAITLREEGVTISRRSWGEAHGG